MNVSLTDPMGKFVRQKVAAGDYETASEVVREGCASFASATKSGKVKCGAKSTREWTQSGPDALFRRNR